jgi:hypothetical protein
VISVVSRLAIGHDNTIQNLTIVLTINGPFDSRYSPSSILRPSVHAYDYVRIHIRIKYFNLHSYVHSPTCAVVPWVGFWVK